MAHISLPDGYELDDDPARIDREVAHAFLSGESYWAKGRERDVMDELLDGATRLVGLYAPDGAMVGMARVVSDRHTVAWLADVFVLEPHRGRGLGERLVCETIDGSGYAHVRWLLGTLDAHELYRKVGFGAPSERMMERRRLAGDPG